MRRPIPLRAVQNAGPALCLLPSGYEVIVPADIGSRLSAQQRKAILSHELAHYEHGDLWKLLAARLLALPHWFNPLAWWAVRNYDECTEWLCDRAASGGGPATLDYAHALLELGSLRLSPASCLGAARGGRLFHRIRRLVSGETLEDSKMKKAILLVSVVGLLLMGSVRVELVAKEPVASTSAMAPVASAPSSDKTEAAPESTTPAAKPSQSPPTTPSESPPALLTAFGKVVDPAGKPVTGASVYLCQWSTSRIRRDASKPKPQDVLAQCQTDAQGKFRFQDVVAELYWGYQQLKQQPWDVVVIMPGSAIAWQHLTAP